MDRGDSSALFRVNLLGTFRMLDPDTRRIEITSKKGVAIIAMLAMANNGERTRAWLQDKLWGSRETAQAGASLRRELSQLRQRLNCDGAGVLLFEYGRVRLNLERVFVDARMASSSDPEAVSRELRGEFLEGLDIPGAEGFEEWLREQRAAERASEESHARNGHAAEIGVAAPGLLVPAARRAPEEPPSPIDLPALAVLSFGYPQGEDAQAHFAEGVAEEIIGGLARSRLLRVTARQSSLSYDRTGVGTARICEDLGVRYLVLGHVRRLADVMRVSAELVDGSEDRIVWAGRYDGPMEALFEMQDNVTRAIIGAIEPALLGAEEMRALQSPRRDTRFWDLFLRGRRLFWRSNAKDVHEAERVLEEALALRPDDASALAILAHCKLYDVWVGASRDPKSAIADAYRIALGAVFAAPTDAFAHYTLGVVLSVMNRGAEAEAEQRRALELNPYLAAALGEIGRLLAFAGRSEDAIAYSDRAIAASPNDPHAWLWFRSKAIARFVAADYEDAARDAADACARGPQRFYLHLLLAACYSAGGRLGDARGALEVGRRLAREAAAGVSPPPESANSLEPLRLGHPFVDPADFDRFLAALDQAAKHK